MAGRTSSGPDPRGHELVLTTRFASIAPLNWVVTPDGMRIYFERCTDPAPAPGAFCVGSDLAMFDLRTGVLTTIGFPSPFDPPGLFVWDEVHERLLTVAARVEVYSSDLVRLGGATVGGRCRQLVISPHTGRVYLNQMDRDYSPIVSTLTAFDSTTYQVLGPGVTRSSWLLRPIDAADRAWRAASRTGGRRGPVRHVDVDQRRRRVGFRARCRLCARTNRSVDVTGTRNDGDLQRRAAGHVLSAPQGR